MNLLEDIQKEAIDASSDLGSLLRKCKVLAAHLGSKELEDWLISESNGYPEDVPVPEYRVWSLQVKGHFSGSFGSGLRNAPIPMLLLPEKVKRRYNEYECRLSIAAVESAIKQNKTGMFQVTTGDLAVVLGEKVYENMNCLQCWAEFSITDLDELLNTVRERVLDFSLAVWKEYPNVGVTNSKASESVSPDKVTQIFHTRIHGGTANLVGTANDSSIVFNIIPNNFDTVHSVLKGNGVSEKDIAELKNAVTQDKPPQSPGQFGPKVSSWIAKMVQKSSEGTWNIAIGAAGSLLAEVISKFYGF
ncbi:MAG: hypothetical protein OXC79_08545 [Candidatus Poribacteria bacterium]|nr:hypothetical protein [Candidatus Poribacteria bacterium]